VAFFRLIRTAESVSPIGGIWDLQFGHIFCGRSGFAEQTCANRHAENAKRFLGNLEYDNAKCNEPIPRRCSS
jgi:hypothetical protein